jgi:hypothetical protein
MMPGFPVLRETFSFASSSLAGPPGGTTTANLRLKRKASRVSR